MIFGKLARITWFGLLWMLSLVLCLILSIVELVVQSYLALLLLVLTFLNLGGNPLDAFQSNPPPIRYTLIEILKGKRLRVISDPPKPDSLDLNVISYSEWMKRSRKCTNVNHTSASSSP